jgi:hypothetical protein
MLQITLDRTEQKISSKQKNNTLNYELEVINQSHGAEIKLYFLSNKKTTVTKRHAKKSIPKYETIFLFNP